MRSHMAVLRKIAEQGLDPKKAYVVSKNNLVPKSENVSVSKVAGIDFSPVKKDFSVKSTLPQEEFIEVKAEIKPQKVFETQDEELKLEEQPVFEQSTAEQTIVEQVVEVTQLEEKPKKSPFKKKSDQKI